MKKNSFRFKRNRKAITALLICVGFEMCIRDRARTTLADKLKLLTGLTPSGFINNVRLQAACRLIDEKKKIRISDLAYAVGFNDPKYFSLCFRKKFGLSPTEYMMKYEN